MQMWCREQIHWSKMSKEMPGIWWGELTLRLGIVIVIFIYIYIYSFTFKSRGVSDFWQQYFLHGVAGPTAYDGCVATLEFQNEVADILYKISCVPCNYDRTQQKVICWLQLTTCQTWHGGMTNWRFPYPRTHTQGTNYSIKAICSDPSLIGCVRTSDHQC